MPEAETWSVSEIEAELRRIIRDKDMEIARLRRELNDYRYGGVVDARSAGTKVQPL